MIGDLLWYESFIPFDAEDIVFPYESVVEAEAGDRLGSDESFFRPHPCDAIVDPESDPTQVCYSRQMWPSIDFDCVRGYDSRFASEIADEKERYLQELRAVNNDFRQKEILEQIVYAAQIAEGLATCKLLKDLSDPDSINDFLTCFSEEFRSTVKKLIMGLPRKEGPLVPLLQNKAFSEARFSEAEERVCELLRSQKDDCLVCDDNAPFGIVELKGKLCQVGAKDCSPCVKNVTEQNALIDIGSRDGEFRFEKVKIKGSERPIEWKWLATGILSGFPLPKPFTRHIQGIGRLRDWDGKGRLVLTENGKRPGKGFHLAFNSILGPILEGVFSTDQSARDRVDFKIKDVNAYGSHQHPSGLQAQGDFVAIAMEKGMYPAVYFLEVKGDNIEFLHTLFVKEGGRGGGAASAGFIRLDDNRFLVVVAGKENGTEGFRFFISVGTSLDANTEWNYIGISRPGTGVCDTDAACVRRSVANKNKTASSFFGGGGGLNFVTDCNQDLYLIAMGGSCGERPRDPCHHWTQVFKVTAAGPEGRSNENLVRLENVGEKYAYQGRPYTQESFRWAGGVAVSSDNRMVLMDIERVNKIKQNDWADGELFYAPEISPPPTPFPTPSGPVV
jgi:hypothetical protein